MRRTFYHRFVRYPVHMTTVSMQISVFTMNRTYVMRNILVSVFIIEKRELEPLFLQDNRKIWKISIKLLIKDKRCFTSDFIFVETLFFVFVEEYYLVQHFQPRTVTTHVNDYC